MKNKEIRYVGHLDILGMSDLVHKNFDDAWGMLSDLVEVKDKLSNISIEFLETKETVNISDVIKAVTFSDTIVLFTKTNSEIELRCMIVLITEIFHKAICKCVPIRAGLSVGEFSFNDEKSMYAGPALIEAYRIGEGSQWLGISLAKSIHEEAIKLNLQTGGSDLVINWDIPLKDKTINGYVINWPALFAHDLKIKHPITSEQFYEGFQSSFGSYEDLPNTVKNKYINTVNFMNHQLEQHEKA